MSDSYHSIGAIQDRARFFNLLERLVIAAEKIANVLNASPPQ